MHTLLLKNLKTYKDEYQKKIDEVKDNIEAISDERKQARYNSIVNSAQSKLDDAQKEYDEQKQKAEDELQDAQNKIDDGKAKIEDGERKLAEFMLYFFNELNIIFIVKPENFFSPHKSNLFQS